MNSRSCYRLGVDGARDVDAAGRADADIDPAGRADADIDALRAGVAAAARRLAAEGLVLGTSGNVSARAEDLVAITPTGAALRDLQADQVAVVDLGGSRVAGELAPSSELGLHLGVYTRYGSGAVVHTHSPIATALSCVLEELPVVHYNMLAFGGSVRVAPYETFGTPELADAVLAALEDRSAALMASHGAVVHAPDVEGAVENALLLEWCCEVYWRATQIDSPKTLTEAQLQAVIDEATRRAYGGTRP
jgi:L-fuculose-phosphate aldolase